MLTIEQLLFFAVKVNEGSGCLYQPAEGDYTYILTANHTVTGKETKITNDSITGEEKEADADIPLDVSIWHPSIPADEFIIKKIIRSTDDKIDLAVILLKRIEIKKPLLLIEPFKEDKLDLFGYPARLRKENTEWENVGCECGYPNEKLESIELVTDKAQNTISIDTHDSLIGFSGSGVFTSRDGQPALAGIFYELKDATGAGNKLNAHYLSAFNPLLKSEGLPALYDPYDIPNPYRGVDRFVNTDAKNFFGRDAEIDKMFNLLQYKQVVAIIGMSGSGKSSLARAGFKKGLPKYSKHFSNTLYIDYDISADPFWGLCKAIEKNAGDHSVPLDSFRILLEKHTRAETAEDKAMLPDKTFLQRMVNELLSAFPGKQIILLLDQFERLFSQHTPADQVTVFAGFLDELIRQRVYLIIAARIEYHKDMLSLPFIDRWIAENSFILPAMGSKALRIAITGPAALYGRWVEEKLVTELINDTINRPGALVLLQLSLQQLWEADYKSRLLKAETFEQISTYPNPQGPPFTGIVGLLIGQAEKAYGVLEKDEADRVPFVLLPLITSYTPATDLTTKTVTTRKAYLKEFDKETAEVAEKLSKSFLLNKGTDPVLNKATTIEIGHEALLLHWPRVDEWLKKYDKVIDWIKREFLPYYDLYNETGGKNNYLPPSNTAEGRKYAAEYPFLFQQDRLNYLNNSYLHHRNKRYRNNAVGIALIVAAIIVSLIIVRQKNGSKSERLRDKGYLAMKDKDYITAAALLEKSGLQDKEREVAEKLMQCRMLMHSAESQSKLPSRLIALSGDGHFALLCDSTQPILWDAEKKVKLFALEPLTSNISNAEFSPDNSRVAISTEDSKIVVYKTSGPVAEKKEQAASFITAMAFSPGNNWIAYSSTKEGTRILDFKMNSPSVPVGIEDLPEYISGIIVTRSEQLILSSYRKVCIIKKKGKEWIKEQEFPIGAGLITCMDLNNQSSRLAVGDENGYVSIFELSSGMGQSYKAAYIGSPVTDIDLSPSGKYILTTSNNDNTKLWTASPMEEVERLNRTDKKPVLVSFCQNENKLRIGFADSSIITWTAGETYHKEISDTDGQIISITFESQNSWLGISIPGNTEDSKLSEAGIIRVIDTKHRSLVNKIVCPEGLISHLTFSNTGKYLAGQLDNDRVIVWETISGISIWKNKRFDIIANTFWFDKSDRLYMYGPAPGHPGYDMYLAIYQMPKGNMIKNVKITNADIIDLTMPGHNNTFATTTEDGKTYLWNDEQKPTKDSFSVTMDNLTQTYRIPDGTILNARRNNSRLSIYDARKNNLLYDLEESGGSEPPAYHPFKKLLAYAGNDYSLKLYDYAQKKTISIRNNNSFVWLVQFSSDGKKLFAVNIDGNISVYNVDEIIGFVN